MTNLISFTTALLLKNIGFPQESPICYNGQVLTFLKHLKGVDADFISAPTFDEISQEILKILPKDLRFAEIQISLYQIYLSCSDTSYNRTFYYSDNMVEVLAKIYINLKTDIK